MQHREKCLESRPRPDGTRVRRYRTPAGRAFATIELPLTVFEGCVREDRFKTRMAGWLKAELSRERQARVLAELERGVKPLAIAHAEGMSEREVQRIRKRKQSPAASTP